MLGPTSLSKWKPRFLLGATAISLSGSTSPRTFYAPPDAVDTWKNSSYRLTLGWKLPEVTSAAGSVPDGVEATAHTLVLECFEMAGASATLPPRRKFAAEMPLHTVTVFFTSGPRSASDSRPDFGFVDVDGESLLASKQVGTGCGPRYGSQDLAEFRRRTGLSVDTVNEALGSLKQYRLHGGLLQRRIFVKPTGSFEWLTVVPEGDWRTVEYGTSRRRLSLRRYVILSFHCTAMGPHRSRDRTMQAIQDAGLWWAKLYSDVQGAVRGCLICREAKAAPLVTGHLRSREYDGPFRYLIIDFVGPMNPPSARGNRYLFTCVCAWSGWYWAIAVTTDDSATAARCLFYYVMCDLAGYPTFIGSDRAKAFTDGVIQELITFFGITHVLGSAYHPQSQSAVERPHREYNAMCKTFMSDTKDWDLVAPVFVWTVRTTAKIFNGMYTPYETITGMKPRAPTDPLLAQPSTLTRVTTSEYVRELVKYVSEVHKLVAEHHTRVRDDQQRAKHRQMGPGTFLSVGDFVLVRRYMDKANLGVSERFRSKHFEDVFQVVEVHGQDADAKAYTLSDLAGNREGLGFTQPVALERLTPVEMLPLAQESDDAPTRIRFDDRSVTRDGSVVAQSLDGKVYVRFDHDPDNERCIDLSTTKYQWL